MYLQTRYVEGAPNHDKEIYIICVVFMALSIVAVILRSVSVRLRETSHGIDDLLVIVALIFVFAESIYICIGARAYGLGRHVTSVSQEEYEQYQKLVYIISLLQPSALAVTKFAILILYRRIFTTRRFKIATNIIGAVVLLWFIGIFLADALICIPVQYNWNKKISGHCINSHLLYIISPLPWILTDFAILLMPLPVLWQLQIERNQKIALSGVFLLGGFACISSVIRYSYVFYSNDDLTWSSYSLTVWNVIEANVTIISACLIVMKPIFVRLWPEKIVAPLRKKPSNSGFTQRSDFPLRAKYSTRLKNLPTSESAASKGLRDEFQEMERHSLDQGHRELPGGCIMVRSNINVSNEIA